MKIRERVPHVGLVAAVTLAAAASLVGIQLACLSLDIRFSWLSRDPAAVLDQAWYLGVLSNFGLCVWAAAIGCAAVGWRVARRDVRSREVARALGGFVALSAMLGIDDGIQFHELLAPTYLRVPEGLVCIAYALLGAAWAVRFRTVLLARVPLPLAIAIAGFAISLLGDDWAIGRVADVAGFFEDGPKLIGQLNWALTGGILALSAIADAHAPAANTRSARDERAA